MESVKIAVLEGDGIGPDIVRSTIRVLEQAGRKAGVPIKFTVLPSGLAALKTHDSILPAMTLEALPKYAGWLLGPITHHLYTYEDRRYVNISGYLRKNYELYANIRPTHSFPGVPSVKENIDLVVVRENTEGFYADRNVLDGNGELRPDENTVISVRVVTRKASIRVARQAFELARKRGGKRKVSVVHKANVLRKGDGLFLQCCREVAKEYPDILCDDFHVDAFAMFLIMKPEQFDVIVTTNMFGDILSDEASGLVGGLGLAPGLNAGDAYAMAQATHGSAPDIEHLHIANPIAEILSGKLLLEWLSIRYSIPALFNAAASIDRAVAKTLQKREDLTPDLKGNGNTSTMTNAIIANLD